MSQYPNVPPPGYGQWQPPPQPNPPQPQPYGQQGAYAQPPYQNPYPPQYAVPPAGQRKFLGFWIFFAITQVLFLIVVLAFAADQPDAYTCASQGADSCSQQQHAWVGGLIFWVGFDVCIWLTAFLRRQR